MSIEARKNGLSSTKHGKPFQFHIYIYTIHTMNASTAGKALDFTKKSDAFPMKMGYQASQLWSRNVDHPPWPSWPSLAKAIDFASIYEGKPFSK
jgi:hypothetical protein